MSLEVSIRKVLIKKWDWFWAQEIVLVLNNVYQLPSSSEHIFNIA